MVACSVSSGFREPPDWIICYDYFGLPDIVAPLLAISSTNPNVLFSTPDDPNNLRAVGPGAGGRPKRAGRHPAARPERPAHPRPCCPTTPSTATRSPVGRSSQDQGRPDDRLGRSAGGRSTTRTPQTAAWNVVYGNLLTTIGFDDRFLQRRPRSDRDLPQRAWREHRPGSATSARSLVLPRFPRPTPSSRSPPC